MKPFFIDIETIKTQRTDYAERLKIEPPGQYKKPESIAKWMEDNADYEKERLIEKTVFNGGLCQVVQLNYLFDDGDAVVFQSEDERELLEHLSDVIVESEKQCSALIEYVGHNIIGFDLRILRQRFICHGIKMPISLKKACSAKSWSDCVFDTMIEWAGFGNRVSMDDLCYYLSIDTPKDGMSGADFGPAWFAGDRKKCADYGYEEIRAMREVYQRINAA